MKAFFMNIFLILIAQTGTSQIIQGTITDRKGEALPGANIFIEGSYDGASSDEKGTFNFSTDLKGKQVLVVRFVGFREYREEIDLTAEEITMTVALKESSNQLGAVTITAGSFEAGDEKKGVVMKPLDILTTAGGLGDIYGAINTLPGTQTVGEEGKIFVRGGDSYETRTFFDGMMIEQPYYAQMPDIPTRGRFSPWLFSGTVFSSGGYSAEYGQALSSALILKSEGLPDQDVSSISLMSVGLGASHTKRWEKTSLSLSGGYTNLAPYFNLIRQEYDWDIAPMGYEGSMVFRQKLGKEGMLKSYASYGYGRSKLEYPGFEEPDKLQSVDLIEKNAYINTTYQGRTGENWVSKAGFSYSDDVSDYGIDRNQLDERVRVAQARYNLTYLDHELYKIKFGGEFMHKEYEQVFQPDSSDHDFSTPFADNLSAAFAELELNLGARFAARLGGRFEYSSLLDKSNAAPRVSLAFKTGKNSQVSLAWGDYYQTPRDEFVRFNPELYYEKATHYIANFQITRKKQIFRIEAYYKDYNKLVKYDSLYSPLPSSYNNQGHGYAKGLDIFWRDERIPYVDYWLSYGYIDTKRNYLNYPVEGIPTFVSTHNARAVVKGLLPKLNTLLGFTYTFASGRTYFNPNNEDFLEDKTRAYHDLSFNLSYLTSVWDNFTVVYFSIGNLLNCDHVFGYRYSNTPDINGDYKAFAITPMSKRFVFLGLFISLTDS